MKTRSIVVTILVICLLIISAVTICLRFTSGTGISKEEAEQILKEQKVPVNKVFPAYMVDMNNLFEVVGDADYVFVGQVDGYIESIYDKDLEEGIETVYSVKVKENIKGSLEDKGSIEIKKAGGVSKNGKSLVIYEYDQLPQIEKTYIFSAYGQPDGSLLCSGFNTNILIEKEDNVKEDPAYKEIVNAYKNEVVTTRKRFKTRYEKVME